LVKISKDHAQFARLPEPRGKAPTWQKKEGLKSGEPEGEKGIEKGKWVRGGPSTTTPNSLVNAEARWQQFLAARQVKRDRETNRGNVEGPKKKKCQKKGTGKGANPKKMRKRAPWKKMLIDIAT